MSMRGVETDPTITSISTLVREERMVMELTHLRYQSDQRVVLNEHQWDSVWIKTVQIEWVSSLSFNL